MEREGGRKGGKEGKREREREGRRGEKREGKRKQFEKKKTMHQSVCMLPRWWRFVIIFIPVLLVLNVCPVNMSAFCNEKKPTHRIYLPNDRNSRRDAESPTDLLYFPFKLISSGSYFKDFKTMTFRVFPQ